jgi:glucose-1-phosphate thymidylyltransferase
MKGLILSGGKGTRLRPITHTSAKQLVPIANKPILFYAIECVVNAGIEKIGIVVGDTKEEVKKTIGNGKEFGTKISYIEQSAPLGLAHAVKIAKDFIDNEPFVMFLGDNLIKGGITNLVEKFVNEKANCQVLLASVPNPHQFGVAELKNGRIINLVEKPNNPASDLALVGVYMFDKTIFEAVDAIKPSKRAELEITDAIQYLIDNDFVVLPHIIDSWWKDTGKLEDMLEANRIMLEDIESRNDGTVDVESTILGKVIIDKDAIIKNSIIRGPAIIGSGTTISDSYIGPFTSIHNNVSINDSEIEHSIVLSDCKINFIGSRIEDSLLGRNVTVHRSERKPKAHRLMVGDNSDIEVI